MFLRHSVVAYIRCAAAGNTTELYVITLHCTADVATSAEVVLSGLRLFVCQLDSSKSYEQILTIFFVAMLKRKYKNNK